MSNILKSVIFGIIEGITEWLPVSSTGHLIILEKFISFNDVSDGFYEMYSVVIQLGAVLSVLILFFRKLIPFSISSKKVYIEKSGIVLWIKILLACIPASVIGLLFNDYIEKQFFNYRIVAYALIFYGFLFIIIERYKKAGNNRIESVNEINIKSSFAIGLFQALSLIPGTSRSGSTILGGIISGASRAASAEFSFFMAIPVMFGAGLLKIIKFGFDFTSDEFLILITGFITALIISLITIKKLMDFVKKHSFTAFGYYRIALGIIVLLFFTFYN